MVWYQRHFALPALRRGCHLVTRQVLQALPEVQRIRVGLLHLFIKHTSAALTLNENADPDVRADLETWLNRLAPEDLHYRHTVEGKDDMPAHAKSSLLGASLLIPITDGQLALGTWQGIYLCEHRDHGEPRELVATIQGEER